MENLILVVHLLVALAIIGLILLQQGKGAEMGASFGAGASQTLFGSSGSGNFFSRMTAILATVFFVTSFTLAIVAKQRTGNVEDLPPELIETVAEDTEMDDVPTLETIPEAAETDDLPEVSVPDEASAPVEVLDDAPDAAVEAAEGSTTE